jgi:hypothetical protein
MNTFDASRFFRVFCNDLHQHWRKIWIASIGFACAALMVYLFNVDANQVAEPDISLFLFPLALIAGGLIFTSTIFADMHHPLQRFQYLTLPYSNCERFLSRYLLTGPLFYLYVLVTYFVLDKVAAGITQLLMDSSPRAFSPFRPEMRWMTLVYFFLHSVMLTGAIYYRSWHLIKTTLAATLFTLGAVFVQIVAVKVVFWDYFDSLWSFEEAMPSEPGLVDRVEIRVGFLFVLHLWVLYMAYRCLCEHEVQDEL